MIFLPWCSTDFLSEEVLSWFCWLLLLLWWWWLWRLSVLEAAAESFRIAPWIPPPPPPLEVVDVEDDDDDDVEAVVSVLLVLLVDVVSELQELEEQLFLPVHLVLVLLLLPPLPIFVQLIFPVQLVWWLVLLEETFWKRTVVFDLDLRMMGLKLVQFMRDQLGIKRKRRMGWEDISSHKCDGVVRVVDERTAFKIKDLHGFK